MFRNKRLWKAERGKVNCSPPLHTPFKKKEKKERKKQRRGEGESGRERKMEREGYEKREGEEKSWALFRLFFFKQWHPVFLDVSLLWQL